MWGSGSGPGNLGCPNFDGLRFSAQKVDQLLQGVLQRVNRIVWGARSAAKSAHSRSFGEPRRTPGMDPGGTTIDVRIHSFLVSGATSYWVNICAIWPGAPIFRMSKAVIPIAVLIYSACWEVSPILSGNAAAMLGYDIEKLTKTPAALKPWAASGHSARAS